MGKLGELMVVICRFCVSLSYGCVNFQRVPNIDEFPFLSYFRWMLGWAGWRSIGGIKVNKQRMV